MLLTELLVKIAVNADSEKLKKFDSNLKALSVAAGVVGTAIAGAAAGLTAFVKSNLGALDEIAQLSRVTGEAAENIQLLGKVAEVNGSSSEAARASIAGLSRVIGEAADGYSRGAKAFEEFGLKARNADGSVKHHSQVLEEVRQKMQGLSEQQQIAMLDKLGIDATMIQTLRLTNAEMAEAMENAKALSLGTATQENVDEAAAFNDAMTEARQMITGVNETIALGLSPTIREIIGIFKQWFIVNNKLIKENLVKFTEHLSKGIRFIAGFIRAINRVVNATIGWQNAIYLVGAAFIWLNRKMLLSLATNPMLLMVTGIAAAIVGLIALIDDFVVYMQGGESYFGEAWQPMVAMLSEIKQLWLDFQPTFEQIKQWLAQLVTYCIEILKGLWEYIEGLWLFWKGLFAGDTDLIAIGFKKMVNAAIHIVKNLFGFIINVVKASLRLFVKLVMKITDFITYPFKKAFSWVVERWNSFVDNFNINAIGTLFNDIIDMITLPFRMAFTTVKTLWDLFTGKDISVDSIKDNFDQVTDFITTPFKNAFDWVKQQYDTYIRPIVDGVTGFFSSDSKEGGGWFSGWFGGDDKDKKEGGEAHSNTVNAAMHPSVLPAQGITTNTNSTADNSVNNSHNTINVTQHITSSANPKQVADQSARAVRDMATQHLG